MIYLCSNTKINDKNVINLNLCEIKFEKFDIDLDDFDTAIFTSKNAIKALEFNNILPKNIEVFVIGKATKEACINFGFSKIYMSDFAFGDEFAREILNLLKNKKVVFFRADEIVSKLDKILLQNNIDLTQIKSYKNEIKKLNLNPLQSNSIIIFTSPKNVKAFLDNFTWDSSFKAIAIGKTTAKTLSEFCNPLVSEVQSVEYCVKLAKSL